MDNSPFARLSAELRNHIFSLALTKQAFDPNATDEHPPTRRGLVVNRERISRAPLIDQPLSMTCRQLRAETRLMYYNVNDHFYVAVPGLGPQSLQKRLKALAPEVLALVRDLHMDIYIPFGGDPVFRQWIELCTYLESVGFVRNKNCRVLRESGTYGEGFGEGQQEQALFQICISTASILHIGKAQPSLVGNRIWSEIVVPGLPKEWDDVPEI
ncbi:hypothetical protein LTR17_014655 [Elasticomyces elasticus]|nr:hypothetical protein LTR17_014655 [Elasticomyces elasticus]